MSLSLVAAPSVEPVDLNFVKQHSVITFDDDDSYVDSLIVVARESAERETGLAFIGQQWALSIDGFVSEICLPKPPLLRVDSIEYRDKNGITQILSPALYRTIKKHLHWYVVPSYGQQWPETIQDYESVKITFTVGFGDDSAAVPAVIKHAICMLVSHYYENREIAAPVDLKEIPRSASALLGMHTVELL